MLFILLMFKNNFTTSIYQRFVSINLKGIILKQDSPDAKTKHFNAARVRFFYFVFGYAAIISRMNNEKKHLIVKISNDLKEILCHYL